MKIVVLGSSPQFAPWIGKSIRRRVPPRLKMKQIARYNRMGRTSTAAQTARPGAPIAPFPRTPLRSERGKWPRLFALGMVQACEPMQHFCLSMILVVRILVAMKFWVKF
jgi:hypothetical protein